MHRVGARAAGCGECRLEQGTTHTAALGSIRDDDADVRDAVLVDRPAGVPDRLLTTGGVVHGEQGTAPRMAGEQGTDEAGLGAAEAGHEPVERARGREPVEKGGEQGVVAGAGRAHHRLSFLHEPSLSDTAGYVNWTQQAYSGGMSSPEALDWAVDNCTIGRTLDILGDRWSFIVLREVFQGIRRFDDLTVRTAIPRTVLTDRLRRLVDSGILRREPYREPGSRSRFEYRLTDKGLDLYPVLIALQTWGNRYLADPEGAPIEFVHRGCDEQVELVLRCEGGHEVARPRDVGGRPGPGAHRRVAS